MSALEQAIRDLRLIEQELRDNVHLARRVHDIATLLERDEAQWIDTAEATQLLVAHSEKVIETWARMGLVRSRREADGQLRVRRDDVLREKQVDDALTGDGDNRPITDEEYAMLRSGDVETLPPEQRAALEEFIVEARAHSR